MARFGSFQNICRGLKTLKPAENYFDLNSKVAIVTGGAGILGKNFCATLAKHGAGVALVDKTYESAYAAAESLMQDDKTLNIIPFGCNISNPNEVSMTVKKVSNFFGKIDILHNNAATKTDSLSNFFEPFESYDLNTWREVMSVNVDGMFLMAQSVGNQILSQGTLGSIIQTASVYGVVAPDQRIYAGSKYLGVEINTPAVYSASKAAVIGLTQYLAAYWGKQNIRVNSLTPGGIESGQNDVFNLNYSNRVPMGRMGTVEELSAALLFLASDASSYVTGQNIVIDGGLTCW